VNNGIARRSWARSPGAMSTAQRAMDDESNLTITLPHLVDPNILNALDDNSSDEA